MPRMHKDTSWTPSSLLNESFNIDDADFIQDPDQQRDQLPQPYRMINKLLGRVIDQVWDHISERESDRIADASRFRPPQYECAVFVQDDSDTVAKTECVAATPDGQFIIMGLQKGLCVVQASSYKVVDIWAEETLHISTVQTCLLADDKYLISTIDDMGACRLYALAGDQIYSVTTVSDPETAGKAVVSGSELSTSGDFLALFTEKPSSCESWVDVLKLPKDAWVKDLDSLVSKAAKKDTSQTSQHTSKSPVPVEEPPIEYAHSSEGHDPNIDKSTENLHQSGADDQQEHRSQIRRSRNNRNKSKVGSRRLWAISSSSMASDDSGWSLKSPPTKTSARSRTVSFTSGTGRDNLLDSDELSDSAMKSAKPKKRKARGNTKRYSGEMSVSSSYMLMSDESGKSRRSSTKDTTKQLGKEARSTTVPAGNHGNKSTAYPRKYDSSTDFSDDASGRSRSSDKRKSRRANISARSRSSDGHSQNNTSPSNQRSSHSFTAASVIMKVLPPSVVTGATYSSVQSACKNLDTHGDVVGTGAHHLLSGPHLDHRKDVFEQIHSDLLKYLPREEPTASNQATIHFLCLGRVLSQGVEANANKSDQPGSVAIWWSKDTQLMAYSLHKQAKDLERKPDLVLPLSSSIVASGVSADGSQLALAMANNNIVVWDMYMSTPRGVIHLGDEGHVSGVTFLDPSVCPQSGSPYPPYPTTTSCYIMVAMDDGHVRLVNCGQMGAPPVMLDLNIMKPEEMPTLCQPMDGIPDLLITCRKNGCVYLHDLHRGNQICEVILPPDYELTSPWQPPIAVGAKGGMLYLKGQPKPGSAPPTASTQDDEDDTQQVEPPPHKLFVFQLRSFPTLDKYRARERPEVPFVVHSVVENRVNSLFRARMTQQSSRVSRMQARWDNLKNEVELLQQLREDRQHKAQRNAFLSNGQ